VLVLVSTGTNEEGVSTELTGGTVLSKEDEEVKSHKEKAGSEIEREDRNGVGVGQESKEPQIGACMRGSLVFSLSVKQGAKRGDDVDTGCACCCVGCCACSGIGEKNRQGGGSEEN
jgi:hypothetical protein